MNADERDAWLVYLLGLVCLVDPRVHAFREQEDDRAAHSIYFLFTNVGGSPSHHVFAPHLLVVDGSLEAVDGRVALAQVGVL